MYASWLNRRCSLARRLERSVGVLAAGERTVGAAALRQRPGRDERQSVSARGRGFEGVVASMSSGGLLVGERGHSHRHRLPRVRRDWTLRERPHPPAQFRNQREPLRDCSPDACVAGLVARKRNDARGHGSAISSHIGNLPHGGEQASNFRNCASTLHNHRLPARNPRPRRRLFHLASCAHHARRTRVPVGRRQRDDKVRHPLRRQSAPADRQLYLPVRRRLRDLQAHVGRPPAGRQRAEDPAPDAHRGRRRRVPPAE